MLTLKLPARVNPTITGIAGEEDCNNATVNLWWCTLVDIDANQPLEKVLVDAEKGLRIL